MVSGAERESVIVSKVKWSDFISGKIKRLFLLVRDSPPLSLISSIPFAGLEVEAVDPSGYAGSER